MFSKTKSKSNHTYTPAKQRAKARRSYGITFFIIVILMLALSQFGENGMATYFRLQSKEKDLVTDVQVLSQENDQLQQEIEGLASDPQVLEKLAREKHNMQKPEEEVLTVFPGHQTPQ
ncbi:MAG: septum formation initiator family protein [bacterium]|nr:septum formation initiator family protein [bacterium]